MIDLASSSIGGYTFGSAADDLVSDFSSSLGEPSSDTEWQRVSPLQACLGASEIRTLSWGDVEVQLERTADDGSTILGGWVVGEGTILGSAGTDTRDGPPTGVSTTEGVGIGSDADLITSVTPMDSGDVLVVPSASAVIIRVDQNRSITGFSSGRNDCLEPSITSLPCDVPVPVRTLPDGTQTSGTSYEFVNGDVIWSDGTGSVGDENTVTQLFDVDVPALEIASDAAIAVERGDLEIRLVPVGDPPLGPTNLFVFDDDSDCVRRLLVGPGLDEDQLQDYAEVLAEAFEPLR